MTKYNESFFLIVTLYEGFQSYIYSHCDTVNISVFYNYNQSKFHAQNKEINGLNLK